MNFEEDTITFIVLGHIVRFYVWLHHADCSFPAVQVSSKNVGGRQGEGARVKYPRNSYQPLPRQRLVSGCFRVLQPTSSITLRLIRGVGGMWRTAPASHH